MRILILGLNFAPEPTGIGKYTGELAVELVRRGHRVRVLTTPPYYPAWRVWPGYRAWAYQTETWQGVEVWRAPLWVPARPGGLKRLLHLLSFALASLPLLPAQLGWRPQVVFCVAPALVSAPAAWLLARSCGARAWLHIQDFEVEAAAGLGLLPGGKRIFKLAAALESWLLRRFDRVSTISERMLARLREKGLDPARLCLLPNWIDPQAVMPLPAGESLRADWELPESTCLVLYSGSLGQKQGLETLISAARLLQGEPHLRFVIAGEGSAKAQLIAFAAGLPNLRFLPLQPPEKLNQLLSSADLHVLPQKSGVADLVMPSKLPGMLASGKAVIACAAADTEVGQVIQQVGRLVPPEDPAALAAALLELSQAPAEREHLGQAGRQLALARWAAPQVFTAFEAALGAFQV